MKEEDRALQQSLESVYKTQPSMKNEFKFLFIVFVVLNILDTIFTLIAINFFGLSEGNYLINLLATQTGLFWSIVGLKLFIIPIIYFSFFLSNDEKIKNITLLCIIMSYLLICTNNLFQIYTKIN